MQETSLRVFFYIMVHLVTNDLWAIRKRWESFWSKKAALADDESTSVSEPESSNSLLSQILSSALSKSINPILFSSKPHYSWFQYLQFHIQSHSGHTIHTSTPEPGYSYHPIHSSLPIPAQGLHIFTSHKKKDPIKLHFNKTDKIIALLHSPSIQVNR